ncbi:uncharacterized protein LOC134846438 [Symsagittifera roscoffensis]|uniref:uncharacterized protein LOC134846438 n=1 Tax=Symsagittifera roscoffensis TaxID=84072 RepID=UPI00307B6FB6
MSETENGEIADKNGAENDEVENEDAEKGSVTGREDDDNESTKAEDAQSTSANIEEGNEREKTVEGRETPKDSKSRDSTRPNTGAKSRVSNASRGSKRPETKSTKKDRDGGGSNPASRQSTRDSRIASGTKKEVEADGVSEMTVPKTPPPGETEGGNGDVLDDNKLDDSSEDQNGNLKQAEGEIPNGFVRQKTSLVDTISRLLPANEEESKKSRIKEALGKLTDEMTGEQLFCSDCEDQLTIDELHICLDCPKWLCNDCKNHHVKSKATRAHEVYTPPSVCAMECTVHGENFSLFCKQCESLVCSQCITQKCTVGKHDLISIDEKERESRDTLEAFAARIKSLSDLNQSKLTEISERVSTFREFEERAKLKIEARFAELRLLLDSMEENVLLELDSLASDTHAEFIDNREKVKLEKEGISKCDDSIKQCLKRNRIGLINTLPMTDALVMNLEVNESNKPLEVSEPSLVEPILNNDNFLSDVEKHVIRASKSGKLKLVENSVIINQMHVRTTQDPEENVIYDFCWVSNSKIAVVDNRNKSLKLLSLDDAVVIKQVFHDNGLCRVCCNRDLEQIIVCDDKYCLYNYDLDLNFKGIIDIPHHIRKPYGMDFLEKSGNFIIGDRQDGQIYELTAINQPLSPNSTQSFSVLRQIASGFSCLDYVTTTSDHFLVSHGNGHGVRLITDEGKFVCEIDQSGQGLNWPLGVAFDMHGNAVICDSCNHRILVISPLGERLKEVKGFYLPRAVKFSDNQEVLIVAERSGRVKLLTYMESSS